MYPRADIIIFGLWDGVSGSTENYEKGKESVRSAAAGVQFNELVRFLSQSDVAQDVDIKFVDLMVDDPGSYAYMVRKLLNSGFRLPIVMINERIRYTGNIPVYSIYNEVKQITENGCMLFY